MVHPNELLTNNLTQLVKDMNEKTNSPLVLVKSSLISITSRLDKEIYCISGKIIPSTSDNFSLPFTGTFPQNTLKPVDFSNLKNYNNTRLYLVGTISSDSSGAFFLLQGISTGRGAASLVQLDTDYIINLAQRQKLYKQFPMVFGE